MAAVSLRAWDIKCLLAHIAGWDTYIAMIVKLLRNGPDVPYRGDNIDGWNEALVKECEGRTWAEVRGEFATASEWFLEEYGNLAEALWTQRFWEQRKPTPAWMVQHNAEHYAKHMSDIEKKQREWGGLSQVVYSTRFPGHMFPATPAPRLAGLAM